MIKFYTYSLPFKTPFVTAANSFQNREGILIEASVGSYTVLCESSPLPGFSEETISDASHALLNHKNEIESFLKSNYSIHELNHFLENLSPLPSVQFSLSCLGLHLLAKRKSCDLNTLFDVPKPRSIHVNEIIGAGNDSQILSAIEMGVQQGFDTFKCKVSYPSRALFDLLRTAVSMHPDIHIRLDANQSWPEDKLDSLNNFCSELPVEYIEEPIELRSRDQIKKAKSKLSPAIAADESIKDIAALDKLLQIHPDLFVIIKPMLLGNLIKIFETIYAHRSTFKNIVATTALESLVGRKMVMGTAFLIGDSSLAHGLNTGKFLSSDISLHQAKMNRSSYTSDHTDLLQLHEINTSHIKPLR